MRRALILTAILLATASAPLAAAPLYQWKDAQGRTVYSDQAPPPSVRNAEQKNFKPSVIEGGESYAARTARQKNPVTLYATACGAPCDQARQLLTDRGIPFSSKDPQASPEAQAELQKLTGQLRVPVLVIGSDKLDGYESEQWQSALDRAGYPKASAHKTVPAAGAAATPAPTPASASAPGKP